MQQETQSTTTGPSPSAATSYSLSAPPEALMNGADVSGTLSPSLLRLLPSATGVTCALPTSSLTSSSQTADSDWPTSLPPTRQEGFARPPVSGGREGEGQVPWMRMLHEDMWCPSVCCSGRFDSGVGSDVSFNSGFSTYLNPSGRRLLQREGIHATAHGAWEGRGGAVGGCGAHTLDLCLFRDWPRMGE